MNLLFDIQYAIRNLFKSLSFTLLTIVVMAIGLGASLFITTAVKHLAWEPMYFPDGDRIINIKRRINNEWRQTLLHDYQKIKDEVKSIDLISGHSKTTTVLSDGYQSIRYQGTLVTGDFFKITGVTPLLGRVITDADQVPGGPPVVMLSYQIWQNYFNGQQDIIGKKIKINQQEHEVVGVATQASAHPIEKTFWLPLKKHASDLTLEKSAGLQNLNARLKPGFSVNQAREEINRIFSNSPELLTAPDQKLTARVFTEKRSQVGTLDLLYTLFAASLCVLSLCCINVANLLLARSNSRMNETAIRLALGAPRAKLIGQTMWEAVFICLLGGAFAIFLAGWGVESTMDYFQSRSKMSEFPKAMRLSLGYEEVFIGIAITLVAVFATGFVPAWRSSKCDFNSILKDGSKTSLGKQTGSVSRYLVGTQITLSCMLMIAAGVLFILIQQGIAAGYGITIHKFISGKLSIHHYPYGHSRVAYLNRVLAEVTKLPGVEAATLVSRLPTEYSPAQNLEPEGAGWAYNDFVRSNLVEMYPNAFDTLGISVLEGRAFDQNDNQGSQKVAIISQLLADKLWPNESPLGKRVRGYWGVRGYLDKGSQAQADKWTTVVGVVPQISHREMFDTELTPNMYVPYQQSNMATMAVVLKTHGNPDKLKAPLAKAVLKIDPNTPVFDCFSLTQQDKENRASHDFIKWMFALFAIAALVMAATGIYGMMSNHIRRRTQEIGIRRALGVPDAAIIRLIMGQSLKQLAIGFGLGLPLGYLASKIFIDKFSAQSLLYTIVYFVVPVIIASVVFLATITPLMRVLRQTPASALRYE
ncbi:MAG: ABC transporter permease [Cellvibrionaceae bacterium]|nr:ABC transporter permease [Cellvibrionaceae bacterium]